MKRPGMIVQHVIGDNDSPENLLKNVISLPPSKAVVSYDFAGEFTAHN
jgi:hypothetical protein